MCLGRPGIDSKGMDLKAKMSLLQARLSSMTVFSVDAKCLTNANISSTKTRVKGISGTRPVCAGYPVCDPCPRSAADPDYIHEENFKLR